MEWGPKLNLVLAWTWILAGFLSGMLLGLGFHKEEFLGGYTSHKRRLYRLGHISFFGLGLLNFMFYLTATKSAAAASAWTAASLAFFIGGITMPICCVLMAHNRNLQLIFSVPVISLIIGAVLTIWQIIRL
jgi:hypothetical protein